MSLSPHTWPRLYVQSSLGLGQELELGPEQSHYLTQVMRLREGESVRLFNGNDGEWRATLRQLPKGKKKGAILHLENQLREQTPEPDLWLCAAPIKRNGFDLVIMKATELGASVIQPVLTARTQMREMNHERFKVIATEAAEQSERLSVPEVREPLPLDDLLVNWPLQRFVLLCAEHGEAQPIAQALSSGLARARRSAAIFTGPEGGYTTEELEKIKALPESSAARLGPRILKADTAAIVALACWQALCGDWQNRDWTQRES